MRKVMIVDDEKMIINSLALGFNWARHGFEVVATATDGREALELMESLRPDVVFTDVKMPGLSGIELMVEAKKRHPALLFVLISGHADFSYAQKAMRLGAIAYCLKPLEDEDIENALISANQELDNSSALRHAALQRFLEAPSAQRARELLNAARLGGGKAWAAGQEIGVGLSLGDAARLFTGNAQCVDFALDDRTHLYLFSSGLGYLAGPAFRAALLDAATNKRLSAFVYDVTSAPDVFLTERLVDLMDQLYVSFFDEAGLSLGRAAPYPPRGSSLTDSLATLANRNRTYEVMKRLAELSRADRGSLAISDAVRIHNLCETLLCRLSNQPYPKKLDYGFELVQRYDNFDRMCQALLKRLEKAVGDAVDTDRLHNETLSLIIRELNATFTQDVSFQELCTRYHINPSYLSQLFKKEIGMTFTGYMTRLRMRYAKELLENTSMLVAEISRQVGYDYYLNFTKLFKKETGMTPKQYRTEQHRE